MGVTFRGGGYIRFERIGKRTIKDGEAAAVWDRFGTHTQIIGPKVVRLFFSTIRFLSRHKAESHQYLVIKYRDGTIEHTRGPCSLYENPAYHDEVMVKDAIVLNVHECIVVDGKIITVDMIGTNHDVSGSVSGSSSGSSTDSVTVLGSTTEEIDTKKMNKGSIIPTNETRVVFIPNPSQHIHHFSWSRIDEEGGLVRVRAENSNNNNTSTGNASTGNTSTDFTVLRTCTPYSFSIILPVPTSDGFLMNVKLHVEYQVSSQATVEMLLKYQDPIARMYHCLQSDVRSRGDCISIETIRAGRQSDINAIFDKKELYASLMDISATCGLEISSVQLTNVKLSADIQQLIQDGNDAMNKVQVESKEKDQRREVHKLELQLEKGTHDLKLASLERQAALDMFELKAHHEKEKLKDEQVVSFLKQIKELDVDMTTFLVASVGSNPNSACSRTNARMKHCVESMNKKVKHL